MKWLIVLSCTLLLGFVPASHYQSEISKNVVRFHVIANSDSYEDQQLKLQVRDAILEYLQEEMEDCETLEDAKDVIVERLDTVKDVALLVVKNAGYSYGVTARLSQKHFPQKNYGDLTFPRGYYDALTVDIGSGKGRNWWCVLFPNLCFNDAVTESKAYLQETMDEDAYMALYQGENVQIRFKIAEIIAELFSE